MSTVKPKPPCVIFAALVAVLIGLSECQATVNLWVWADIVVPNTMPRMTHRNANVATSIASPVLNYHPFQTSVNALIQNVMRSTNCD
jgi:hypothetical protein